MINVDLKIEITKRGLLEEGSLNYLFDLYLPLIGKDSAFLYMFLMNSIKTNRIFSTTNELINKCEMSLQDFLFAKKTLESIGLLSFYEKNDSSSYLYILNDVETPKNFFNNLVLKGLFIETVGEERFFEIINKYETKVNEEDYVNQSAKIQDSFQVIFDVKALDMNNGDKLLGRSKNNIKDNFSDIKLLNYLKKNTQINVKEFDEKYIEFAHKVGTLYGLSEEVIGSILSECYNPFGPKGRKFDENEVKRKAKAVVKSFTPNEIKVLKKSNVNGNSEWATKIRKYEETAPRLFLKEKQNGIDVVDADKNLLERLAFEFNFSSGMINALIDFVLTKKDGELSKNYILKLASTLIRKKCKSTLDVVNVLYDESKATIKAKNEEDQIKNDDSFDDEEVDFSKFANSEVDFDLGD